MASGSRRVTTIALAGRHLCVVLNEATPRQRELCYKLAATGFAAPLSEGSYIDRERYLENRPLTRQGRYRVWCVYLADDPAEILATCKTIPRELLVKRADGFRDEQGYCITSVITNHRYRRLGLASLLLEYVGGWLDGPGEAAASMLYTSIGDFYATRGWKALPAHEYVLASRHVGQAKEHLAPSSTRLLVSDEIPELCARDVENARETFMSGSTIGSETQVTVLPTMEIITWLHDRAAFIGKEMLGRAPENHGSICDDGSLWMYWYHDFRKGQLAVQRICTTLPLAKVSGKALASLLLRALEEAEAWGLAKVVIWGENPILAAALELLAGKYDVLVNQGERLRRSIPSMRWRHDVAQEIRLHNNEFFAWS